MNAPNPAASLGVSRPALHDSFLDQIPSETTPGERRLLFDFFKNRWCGAGTVVELGPFLGGTTRAIAHGMVANSRLAAGASLHTFDKFDEYYSPEQLRQAIEPLVAAGAFSREQADELCRTADFERLFHAIHGPHDYARLVSLHNSPLPDRPEEIDGSSSLSLLASQPEISALFVDGCKSWASTHYAMKFLLPRMIADAPVIFQDFGWYTCFWISTFTYAFRDFLQMTDRVDATYVFRLKRKVTAEDVTRRFAKSPAEMGTRFFNESAADLMHRSRKHGDLRGELIAQLHHTAGLLTIGQRAAAADVLRALDVKRYASFAYMIRGCLKSPTYLPGGKQVLWKDAA